MSLAPPNIPELFAEQLALADEDATTYADAERRLGASAAGYLAAIAESNADILERYPPVTIAAEITRRARGIVPGPSGRALTSHRMRLGLALAGTAVGVLVVTLWIFGPQGALQRPAGGGLRTKGTPALLIYLKDEQGVRRLADKSPVSAGDLLRIGYRRGAARFGAILSVDGAGVVTTHFPVRRGSSTELGDGRQLLPFAYQLDAAPDFERFYFFSAPDPLDVETLAERLRRHPDHLKLPAHVAQQELLLRKANRGTR